MSFLNFSAEPNLNKHLLRRYWNATKVDEKKRKRIAEALLNDGGKKKKKRAKTKGKMADFCECISNFIQFE